MSFITWSSRHPSYFLSSGFLYPTIAIAELRSGSHDPLFVISATTLARIIESRRLGRSFPFSATQSGKHEERPLADAAYGYMVAPTSIPAARAESIFAII